MRHVSDRVLEQMASQKSVIFTDGFGPCPVFARGDRRTVATHWFARDVVKRLKTDGVLTEDPRGLILSSAARAALSSSVNPAHAQLRI